MPGPFAQQAFQLRDEHGENQVGSEKAGGAARFVGRRLLEDGKEREQNKNRTRVNDLAFEMVPVGLMGAHARGRVS